MLLLHQDADMRPRPARHWEAQSEPMYKIRFGPRSLSRSTSHACRDPVLPYNAARFSV